MSNIASIGSSQAATMTPRRGHRPDPTEMANDIFARLDTKGQGYIEKSDLQSALNSLSGSDSANASTSASSVDDLFSKLDGNSDGKVTKSELADSMKSLADALDSQAMSSRMGRAGPPHGSGHGGHGEGDAGLTKDQLTSMASDLASTDSKRAGVMSDVASNFDKADTDGDGKVSFKEAMAYEQSKKTGSSAASSDTAASNTAADSTSATQETQARMMQQLIQLIHAYGDTGKDAQSTAISAIA